jgi:hypothetical protein
MQVIMGGKVLVDPRAIQPTKPPSNKFQKSQERNRQRKKQRKKTKKQSESTGEGRGAGPIAWIHRSKEEDYYL